MDITILGVSHTYRTQVITPLYKQIKIITRTTKQQQQQITKPTSHKHEDILIIRTHFSTPNWTQSVGSGQVVYKLACLQCKLPGMYTNNKKNQSYRSAWYNQTINQSINQNFNVTGKNATSLNRLKVDMVKVWDLQIILS